jgi:uncharacterized protein YgiB involved in biofilm formation
MLRATRFDRCLSRFCPMARRPRKSSACVTLVLIGAAALSGCSGETPGRRASYATKEACLADWGDPKECEEQPRSSSSRSYGPTFGTWHSYNSSRSRSSSSSSRSVSRGGFGSRGSSAS